MRKPKTHYVTRGQLTGSGPSKTDAKADLDRQISHLCEHGYCGAHIEYRFGRAIVLWPIGTGWAYTILNSEPRAHGERHYSSCSTGIEDKRAALISARYHVAQNEWNHKVTDDAAFVASADIGDRAADLANWIKWQREHYCCGFWIIETAPGKFRLDDRSEFNRWDPVDGFDSIGAARAYAYAADDFKCGRSADIYPDRYAHLIAA